MRGRTSFKLYLPMMGEHSNPTGLLTSSEYVIIEENFHVLSCIILHLSSGWITIVSYMLMFKLYFVAVHNDYPLAWLLSIRHIRFLILLLWSDVVICLRRGIKSGIDWVVEQMERSKRTEVLRARAGLTGQI
jgi:hypothetical protein